MKEIIFKTSLLSVATALLLSMSGCSDSSSSSTTTTTPPTPSTEIDGKAVDGYLHFATVCLDLNEDGYCQIGDEPASYTDELGSFSIELTGAQKDANPDYATAPLLVYSGYDVDTGADFTGKLRAPQGEGAVNVTPISTIVHSMIAESNQTKAQAQTAVKTMLNLPEDADLDADPVAESKKSGGDTKLLKASLKLQKTVEILAKAKETAGSTANKNETVNNLYKELAKQLVTKAASTNAADHNLSLAINTVVAEDTDLQNDSAAQTAAMASATLITGQIELLTDTDTAVIGTKIGAVLHEVAAAVEDGADITTLDINTSKAFSLLHAEELLRITNTEAMATASDVQTVLIAGGMTETAFLPVETEISLLKDSANTFVVGAALEGMRIKDDADIQAEQADIQAEAEAIEEIAKLDEDAQVAAQAELEAEHIAAEAAEEAARLEEVAQAINDANSTDLDLSGLVSLVEDAQAQAVLDEVNAIKERIQSLVNLAQANADVAAGDANAALVIALSNSDAQTASDAAGAAATAASVAATAAATTANTVVTTVDGAKALLASVQALVATAKAETVKAVEALVLAQNAQVQTGTTTAASTIVDIAQLKADVNALIDSPATGATVADAKYTVNQIRETALTFANDNEATGDLNTSTILGNQVTMIDEKIQPAVEDVASDINVTMNALQNSLEAFGDDLNASFDGVLTSIEDRMNAIDAARAYTDDTNTSWTSVTATDNVSYTSTENTASNTATEVITFNGQTVTAVIEIDGPPSSITKSGTLSLSGTSYDLNVTSLDFNGTHASLAASGLLTGTNGTMNLETLAIEMDMTFGNDGPDSLQNPNVDFNGTISANGRSVNGALSVTDGGLSIEGRYTGATGEPVVNGSLALSAQVNPFLNDLTSNAFENSEVGSYAPLMMVTLSDGSKHFVLGVAAVDTTTYSLYAQGIDTTTPITCKRTFTNIFDENKGYGESNIVNCTDSLNAPVALSVYHGYDDQILVTINGEEKLINDAFFDGNGMHYNLDGYDSELYIDYFTGQLMMDGQAVTVTNAKQVPRKNPMDRDFSLSANGSIEHGTTKISANVGVKQIGNTTTVGATDLEITNGESFAKVAELSASVKKDMILGDDNNDHYYSQFESYTRYYDNNDDDNGGDDFNNFIAAKLVGAQISITDINGTALSIEADISMTNADAITAVFDGSYSYGGTIFVGHVDTNFVLQEVTETYQCGLTEYDLCTDTYDEPYGHVSVFGSVENSLGFEPFTITATAEHKTDNSIEAYALFTRGSGYELGMHATFSKTETDTIETDTAVVNLADNRGVIGTLNNTNTYDKTTNVETEGDGTLYIKDSAGSDLGAYGANATSNDWEIVYSDDTTETLF